MFAVNPVRRTEVHGNAVLNDAVLIQDLIEDAQRTAAVDHEIFRNNLEPVDDRLTREDVIVVRRTQANANAVVRKSIKPISGQLIFSQSEFQKRSSGRRFLFHRLSVSPAAALTLAGVLTLASVIGRLAAALTFAGVLAFTSVPVLWIFRFLGLFRLLTRVLARGVQTSLGAGQQI